MSINFLQVSWNGKEDACYEESVEKTASERTEGRNWKIPGGADSYDRNDRICIWFSGCRWKYAESIK